MIFAARYTHLTQRIVELCPGPDKFAHSYVGLGIWLAAGLALRNSRRSLWPLLVVVAAEVTNEILDRIAHGSWHWPDTLGDAAATLFWPVVLTALLRWTTWAAADARGIGG